MKKILIAALLGLVAFQSFSQNKMTNSQYYLDRSKSQRSAAYGLLIGGGVAVGLGFLIGDRKESSFGEAGTGVIIGGLGILSMLGSVPLFIASSKNKRRANLSVSTGSIYLPGKSARVIKVGLAFPI